VALHALELEDGRGPDGAFLVRLGGIEGHGLEAGQFGGPGIGLLPCPSQAQDDDVLGQVLWEGLLGRDQVEQLRFPAERIRWRWPPPASAPATRQFARTSADSSSATASSTPPPW